MKALIVLLFIALVSCESSKKLPRETSFYEFFEFQPEKNAAFQLDGYDIEYAYSLDSLTVIAGYTEGDLDSSETPTKWGDRLLVCGADGIKFESQPVGDVYLYEPHFFKNKTNHSVIVVCQLGFEYYFGGEAFLLENGNMQYMGLIDMESPNAEVKLVEILKIKESADGISFTFETDSLIYKPGAEDVLLPNDDIHYLFQNSQFELKGIPQ